MPDTASRVRGFSSKTCPPGAELIEEGLLILWIYSHTCVCIRKDNMIIQGSFMLPGFSSKLSFFLSWVHLLQIPGKFYGDIMKKFFFFFFNDFFHCKLTYMKWTAAIRAYLMSQTSPSYSAKHEEATKEDGTHCCENSSQPIMWKRGN